MSFHINTRDGEVTLPNGCVISSHLSQDEFRAGQWFETATERDVGTRPFVHYDFNSGEVEGKKLLVNLIFYDQMLLEINLETGSFPPGSEDWSNYWLEVEAARKRFHEELLRRMLGEPTSCKTLNSSQRPPALSTLDQPCFWKFPWGGVGSFHDPKGGGTFFRISYGNRNEEASKSYRTLKKGAAGSW